MISDKRVIFLSCSRRGCTAALGPMEVCTWFPYRANLGPAGRPPFVMEPAADPAPWLALGYRPAGEYASSLHRSADFVDETAPHRARAAVFPTMVSRAA